jgi:hypothetical protein
MKTINLTMENMMSTEIVIDKIFEIRNIDGFYSYVISIGGAKTKVCGTPDSITEQINQLLTENQ